jgi:ribose 5-phosphate isomerase A
LDARFAKISDLGILESELKAIPGVVESGLFIGMAELVYVGSDKDLKILRKK